MGKKQVDSYETKIKAIEMKGYLLIACFIATKNRCILRMNSSKRSKKRRYHEHVP